MKRSKPDTSLDTATSSTMGFRNDDVVIAPKVIVNINSRGVAGDSSFYFWLSFISVVDQFICS